MFSNRDLQNMIVPLFGEQLLVMLVSMADTLVVSFVGQKAVSGGSLVNSLGIRLVLFLLFGIVLNQEVMGIAWAMCLDWVIRGMIFYLRFSHRKWKVFQVI